VVIFATQIEQAIFREIASDVQTVVIPNGVDTEYFCPSQEPRDQVPTVIFTGALDYSPNIEGICHFSQTILPLVRRRIPAVRFLIVGRHPCRRVLRLNRLPGITVVGAVPDVRPYMRKAHVAVVPLRIARGIQNKILEAMAMEMPVVASPKPAQGITAEVNVEWFVEDSPESFADQVIRLLHDSAVRSQVGRRARDFVKERHSWQQILPDVASLVEDVATGRRFQILASSKSRS
jgi:glycosyltransferase involved in cell wall biosynthesis